MAENYFSKAIKLINKKLTITQMVENGLQAYVYPNDTIDYACKVLNSRELKLYLQLCGQADNFNGAMKFYCDKANIKSNHYSEILDSLEKKYIEEYNSLIPNGYNMTKGGDAGVLGLKMTDEQKELIRQNALKSAEKYKK